MIYIHWLRFRWTISCCSWLVPPLLTMRLVCGKLILAEISFQLVVQATVLFLFFFVWCFPAWLPYFALVWCFLRRYHLDSCLVCCHVTHCPLLEALSWYIENRALVPLFFVRLRILLTEVVFDYPWLVIYALPVDTLVHNLANFRSLVDEAVALLDYALIESCFHVYDAFQPDFYS